MIKPIGLLIFIFSLITFVSSGQEFLDIEKYRDCELFSEKKDYDVQKRIDEIKELEGKLVTVYQVSGKRNKIKLTYTGIVKIVDYPNETDESRAKVITVLVNGKNGNGQAYFPLTYDKKYRIYLTDKLDKKTGDNK